MTSLKPYRELSVPAYVYNTLPHLTSIEDAEQALVTLKLELNDIYTQMGQRKYDQVQDKEYAEWRLRVMSAKRLEEVQIKLLKLWILDNKEYFEHKNGQSKKHSASSERGNSALIEKLGDRLAAVEIELQQFNEQIGILIASIDRLTQAIVQKI